VNQISHKGLPRSRKSGSSSSHWQRRRETMAKGYSKDLRERAVLDG
jgi:hypothetical protein